MLIYENYLFYSVRNKHLFLFIIVISFYLFIFLRKKCYNTDELQIRLNCSWVLHFSYKITYFVLVNNTKLSIEDTYLYILIINLSIGNCFNIICITWLFKILSFKSSLLFFIKNIILFNILFLKNHFLTFFTCKWWNTSIK